VAVGDAGGQRPPGGVEPLLADGVTVGVGRRDVGDGVGDGVGVSVTLGGAGGTSVFWLSTR